MLRKHVTSEMRQRYKRFIVSVNQHVMVTVNVVVLIYGVRHHNSVGAFWVRDPSNEIREV